MTRQTTPQIAARAATKEDHLALGTLTLIGMAGKPGDWRALLRGGSGEIVSADLGKRTRWGRVIQIGPEALTLRRGMNDQRLTLKSA